MTEDATSPLSFSFENLKGEGNRKEKRKHPFHDRSVQISLYGYVVALYDLVRFRFESLLAEESTFQASYALV